LVHEPLHVLLQKHPIFLFLLLLPLLLPLLLQLLLSFLHCLRTPVPHTHSAACFSSSAECPLQLPQRPSPPLLLCGYRSRSCSSSSDGPLLPAHAAAAKRQEACGTFEGSKHWQLLLSLLLLPVHAIAAKGQVACVVASPSGCRWWQFRHRLQQRLLLLLLLGCGLRQVTVGERRHPSSWE
jgi:hypothetical protein